MQAQWVNVDLERGTLFLPETKSGRGRHVVLNPAAVELIRQQPRQADNPY